MKIILNKTIKNMIERKRSITKRKVKKITNLKLNILTKLSQQDFKSINKY